jgi:hypothetical protein
MRILWKVTPQGHSDVQEKEPMLPPLMMREWARHLLAYEAVAATTSLQTGSPTFRVYEKLRLQLCPLVGVDGFQVLAARALKLAKSNAPSLAAVHITAVGCLSGFGPPEAQTEPESDRDREAGVVFIAQLFGLFLTFLGPATTARLVQNVFPSFEPVSESEISNPFEDMLQEVNQLKSVSERLQALAGKYPAVEDGLVGISGNIRDIATILDVFAVIRNNPDGLQESDMSDLNAQANPYLN